MNVSAKKDLFVWHDLFVENVNSAISFYSQLFGWGANESTVRDRACSSVSYQGKKIASVIEIQGHISILNRWMPYILVDNLDRCLAKAAELGGHMPLQTMNTFSLGRFGLIIDPLGVPIAVVEKQEPIDWQEKFLYSESAFCWHDIMTVEPRKTIGFFESVFGWKLVSFEVREPPDYTALGLDDLCIAGVRRSPSGMSMSGWNCYVSVPDVRETADACCRLGGSIICEPSQILEWGSCAVLADNSGAVFSVWERPVPEEIKF